MKVPRAQTHRAVQLVHGWWSPPGDVGLSGYNTESLTVDHSERSDWRVSRSLHPKGLFCRFRKKSKSSSSQSKVVDPVDPTSPHFCLVFFNIIKLVLVINIAEMVFSNIQSINTVVDQEAQDTQ